MKSVSLYGLALVLGGIGCARENPAFDGSGSADGSAGATGGQATSAGPGEQSISASGDASQGQTSGASGAASVDDTGDASGNDDANDDATSEDPATSESGEPMEETADGPLEIIVYATPPIPGAFAKTPEAAWNDGREQCREIEMAMLPGLDCDRTWPLLGMYERTVEEITDAPGGLDLLDGEVIAPDGTLIAEDFIALSQSTVTPEFGNAVSAHLPDMIDDIGVWWGQTPGGEVAEQCNDWSDVQSAGAVVIFDHVTGLTLSTVQGCANTYHLLCACF